MNSEQRNQRSFKNYIINRRFQLKWTTLILVLTVGVFATLAGYIHWQEQHASTQIIQGLNQMGYEAAEIDVMTELFEGDDQNMLWLLVAIGTALVVVLAGVGILLTHRVAGPVYALGCFIGQVRDGSLRPVRGFRKGDEFRELAEGFQGMVASLREKEEEEIGRLETIGVLPGLPADAAGTVREMIAEKRSFLD